MVNLIYLLEKIEARTQGELRQFAIQAIMQAENLSKEIEEKDDRIAELETL